jgi:hypothetical protein
MKVVRWMYGKALECSHSADLVQVYVCAGKFGLVELQGQCVSTIRRLSGVQAVALFAAARDIKDAPVQDVVLACVAAMARQEEEDASVSSRAELLHLLVACDASRFVRADMTVDFRSWAMSLLASS